MPAKIAPRNVAVQPALPSYGTSGKFGSMARRGDICPIGMRGLTRWHEAFTLGVPFGCGRKGEPVRG